MSADETADIRSRFDFIPDDAKRIAELFGLDLDPKAPKHFEFYQRFETKRVTDANGFYVREKNAKGFHAWKVIRRGYVEVWLCIGSFRLNLSVKEGIEPPTMEAAQVWACDFAGRYGFEPKYRPTGAEETRSRPRAKVLPFTAMREGDGPEEEFLAALDE